MLSLLFILANPNCSYLSSTTITQQASIWGTPKQVAALQQNYYDRTRNFNELDTSYTNQLSYYQNFSGHSQSYQDLYAALKQSQVKPYVGNTREAQKRGDIDPAVTTTGVIVSSVSGNPVKSGDFEGNLNATNGSASGKYKFGSVEVNSQSSRDPYTAWVNNTELYKLKVEAPIALGWSTNSSYGGTTGRLEASLSHPLFSHTVFVVNKSWDNNSNILTEVSGKVGYGISF